MEEEGGRELIEHPQAEAEARSGSLSRSEKASRKDPQRGCR